MKPLILYFIKDEGFLQCPHLVRRVSGRVLMPSFDKGLLIVGGFGNGKTSVMQVFKRLFLGTPLWFKGYSANVVVEEYEGCNTAADKQDFWRRMTAYPAYFDDVKSERVASNYGKANLFKDILEQRYTKKSKTFITCNYAEAHPDDLEAALGEFCDKYGHRVYDRLFELFNVVEFKGGSFRR